MVAVDQAVSSATNFLATLVALRRLELGSFGQFALAYTLLQFLLVVNRGLIAEPLLVRLGRSADRRSTAAAVLGAGAISASSLGTAMAVVSLVLPADISTIVRVAAVLLPGLFLLDLARYVMFATGAPQFALVLDLSWLALAAVALYFGRPSPAGMLLAWGGTATIVVLGTSLCLRWITSLRLGRDWLAANHDLGLPYALEVIGSLGASQVALFLVAAIAGSPALGLVSGARIVLGPLNLLFASYGVIGIRKNLAMLEGGNGLILRSALRWGAALGFLTTAWGVSALVAPNSLLEPVIGSNWVAIEPLVLPATLGLASLAFRTSCLAAIRALEAQVGSRRAQMTQAVAEIAGATIGAYYGGALGAAIGFAIAQFLGSANWIRELAQIQRPAVSISAHDDVG